MVVDEAATNSLVRVRTLVRTYLQGSHLHTDVNAHSVGSHYDIP